MKRSTPIAFCWGVIFALVVFFGFEMALADDIVQTQTQNNRSGGKSKMNKPTMKQNQKQQQQQAQTQGMSNVISTSAAASVSGVSAGGGNSSLEYSSVVESSAPDIIMVPSNNTSDCMKVYGLSFSTQSGGAGIGWPYRDKSCDFESAADDAAAEGQHGIAWYWRCHKKNLYKTFDGNGRVQKIDMCHFKMLQMHVKKEAPAPVVINCEHDETHGRIFEACQVEK